MDDVGHNDFEIVLNSFKHVNRIFTVSKLTQICQIYSWIRSRETFLDLLVSPKKKMYIQIITLEKAEFSFNLFHFIL